MFKKIIHLIIAASFLPIFSVCSITSPTERYFEEVISYEDLKDHYIKSHNLNLDENFQFYFDIIEYERLTGFFGYHGCSQQYRIFQDILRAVFEEALEIPVPADFQFLRIPGISSFDLEKGVASFYEKFDRKSPTQEVMSVFLSDVVLAKINTRLNVDIALDALSEEEIHTLWTLCEQMFALIDTLAMEDHWAYFNELEDSEDVDDVADDEDMVAIRYSFEKRDHESLKEKKKHETYLKMLSAIWMISRQIPFDLKPMSSFEPVEDKVVALLRGVSGIDNEADLRDIIETELDARSLMKQLLDAMYHGKQVCEYKDFVFPYSDVKEEQQSLVVALNISLFGNYFRWDESTLYVHGRNSSVEGGEDRVYTYLKDYFKKIGLDHNIIIPLVRLAEEELKNAEIQTGCILQFFDKSSGLYEDLEVMAYTSHSFGIPIKDIPTRDILTGKSPFKRKSMDIQARIVCSNQHTLSPFGRLGILRHEIASPDVAGRINEKMRELIKNARIKESKRNAYKARLEELWQAKFN